MSGLNFQVVPVAFTQGQDTRTQRKLVVPGKWDTLINYSLSEENTPKRRDGCQPLVAAASGCGLATHGNQLLAINDSTLSSYSSSQGTLNAQLGKLGNVLVSKDAIRHSAGSVDSPDCASSGANGVTLYAWRDTTGGGVGISVSCTLVDEVTGTKIIDARALRTDANAICPRVVYDAVSGVFLVFYVSSTTAHRLYCTVVTAAGVVGTETTLVSNADLIINNFDSCFFTFSVTGDTGAAVAYRWNDGITSVRAAFVKTAVTTPSVVATINAIDAATIPTANVRGLAVNTFDSGDAGVFALQDSGTPGIEAAIIDTTFHAGAGPALVSGFAQVAAESHIVAGKKTLGGDFLIAFADQIGALGTAAVSPLSSATVDVSLSVFDTRTVMFSASFSHTFGSGVANGPEGPWIAGKPIQSTTGAITLPCFTIEASTGTTLQNAFFAIDSSAGAVVAKALYGSYGFRLGAPKVATPCSTPSLSPGFALAVPEVVADQALGTGVQLTQVGLSRLTLTPNSTLPSVHAELGPVTFFSGGQLCSYDGSQLTEHGFSLFPENIGLVGAAGAGVDNGVHQVVAVYEWVDAQGQRHQSSPSPAASITMPNGGAGNHIVNVDVPSLLLTQKGDVTIALYMTQAAGTIFYRVTTVFTATPNDVTLAFVGPIAITTSDAVLAGNEPLYTQPDQAGTTLPNDSPPPVKALAVSQNRLWILDADNPLAFHYSQELLNGFGLQFNGLYGDLTLGGLVPSESGGTVALSPLDEKTIILCDAKLYVVFGNGPDSAGNNNGFSEPQEIPSDVGCQDARSVLKMPNGIIFKSEQGFHLLGRDLNVTYIGEGVSAFDSYTVVSATLMQDRKECRFEVQSPGEPEIGVTLVYSYLFPRGQWSVFQRSAILVDPGIAASDAVWWPALSRYAWLTKGSNGLNMDAPGVLSDTIGGSGAINVPGKAITAWLRPGALEGFQRVRRLFLSMTPSANGVSPVTSLIITVDFDDQPGTTQSYAVIETAWPVAPAGTVDLRHKLSRQKCKSVRFTFDDVGDSPLGGIQALALELGMKRGVNKLPAAQTVG